MNKIYIVEGMDRCGKSTIVNALRQKIKNPKILVMHSSKPPKNVEDVLLWSKQHYYSMTKTVCELWSSGFDIILDRSYIGEFVYGPLYRNMDMNDHWMFRLEKNVLLHNQDREGWYKTIQFPKYNTPTVSMIILTDTYENLSKRDDGLSLSSKEDMLMLEKIRFMNAFTYSDIRDKIFVDWSKEEFSDDAVNNLVEKMTNAI